MRLARLTSLALACSAALAAAAADNPLTVLPPVEKSKDVRLGPPKTLNDYFPFTPPKSKDEWAKRRKELREQILVAEGLWPLPEKTSLNPVVHGKIARDGYTVEKVYFASLPGHYVSGNLYRPVVDSSKPAKFPAVLCPHGHWANGRFYEATDAEAAKQIKMGAEKTLEGAKYPLQARCANLAMMGFVVFHYDMVGNADSTAIPHRTGFTDAAAELRLQSFMGLQTWNSIRALDFVESLPDVDKAHIGVTGASGGGTQTFVLCAVDDRPAAAFPAVMVGTAMQGGCVCENCSGLRVGTGNVEIAGLFAPKPLALSGADDWTKEIMTKGYPELKQLYALLGAENNVAAKAWTQFPHNYNQIAREFMYGWFNKHLLGKDEPVAEKPFRPIPPKELSVFDAAHPRPADELPADKLRAAMAKASDAQLAKLVPTDAKSLAEFRRVFGTAFRVLAGGGVPAPGTVGVTGWNSHKGPNGMTVVTGLLGRTGEGDAVPAVGLMPDGYAGTAVIWVHPKGKASLMENGSWAPAVQALLDKNVTVLAVDLFGTGEATPEKPAAVDKQFAGFTYGYNRTPVANRVRDVLTAVARLRNSFKAKAVHVVGWGEFGPIALLAKSAAGDAVAKTAADLDECRFDRVSSTADPMLLPGLVKYGGLDAVLVLCAPGDVLAFNAGGASGGPWSKAAYTAAGAPTGLTREAGGVKLADVAAWLAK